MTGGSLRPERAIVVEDSGFTILARVLDHDGAAAQQADVSAISYKVFDLSSDTPNTPTESGTLVVADVVFDTLQTDSRWTKDQIGYNFRWAVPASFVPTGDRDYQFEVKFTPAAGEVYHLVPLIVRTLALRGS